MLNVSRAALLVTVLAVSGCPSTKPYLQEQHEVAAQQWQDVIDHAPLVRVAYLQSLIALAEGNPERASQARAQAFELARHIGVVTGPVHACPQCPAPRNDAELHGYEACLEARLNCLQPR